MEQLRPDIERVVSRMPGLRRSYKEAIRLLPELLLEHEQVVAIVPCTHYYDLGLSVLTNDRILFTPNSAKPSLSESFPLITISSIEWISGIPYGRIAILADGNKTELKNCRKADGKLFIDVTHDRLARARQQRPAPQHYQPSGTQQYPAPQAQQYPYSPFQQHPSPQQHRHPTPQSSPVPEPQHTLPTRHAMPPKLTKTQVPIAAAPQAQDHMASLRQLAELHQAGILTDQEFTQKKAEILARL